MKSSKFYVQYFLVILCIINIMFSLKLTQREFTAYSGASTGTCRHLPRWACEDAPSCYWSLTYRRCREF